MQSVMDVPAGSFNVVMGLQAIKTLTGILCMFDTLKHNAEIKLLIGCTEEKMPTLYILN